MTFNGLALIGLLALLALLVLRPASRRDVGTVYDRLLEGDAQDALAELATALRAQQAGEMTVLPPHAPTPAPARE